MIPAFEQLVKQDFFLSKQPEIKSNLEKSMTIKSRRKHRAAFKAKSHWMPCTASVRTLSWLSSTKFIPARWPTGSGYLKLPQFDGHLTL